MATGSGITATVEQRGAKYHYVVYVDGVERASSGRTSTHRYEFVLVQRWAPVGSEGEYGDPEMWAARYSRKPKPVGAKIEYGYCAEVVEITERKEG